MKDFAKIYRMSQKTNYCDNIRFMKGEQIMYKYAYETVSCHLSGYGLGAGTVYCIDDYRSIIEKRASQGWRYVKQRGTGHVQVMDLIFEKEE